MTAYYNECDPFAAKWLENLIAAGHIAPGDVDTRSIEDVRPDDLAGYTQCHFFAGIGVWSYALRRGGVPDDTPLWTGSCPCQPFSAAGAGDGVDDERHLWPHWFHLVSQCRPATLLGEQVASKAAEEWIDLVCDDLGSLGYATGAVAFPSAGVGAPHIRDRLYWMANAGGARSSKQRGRRHEPARLAQDCDLGDLGNAGNAGNEGLSQRQRFRGIADGGGDELGRVADAQQQRHDGSRAARAEGEPQGGRRDAAGYADASGWLADADSGRLPQERRGTLGRTGEPGTGEAPGRPGPVNGFWRDADWLLCRDGRWRPVRPGSFPLVTGARSRVGRLRAYGNALNASAAQAFVQCVMEVLCPR